MVTFEKMCNQFFDTFGSNKQMVLSTSLNDKVTSRMMSIILIDGIFYFQTDTNFRKYKQIQINPNVALCTENIQVEGTCLEIGLPQDNSEFCKLYRKNFAVSYELYSGLKNERLFAVNPTYIQRWIYENGSPFVEMFDFQSQSYQKKAYVTK